MQQIIKYTREQMDTLFDAGWKGSGSGGARAIKLARPECPVHQIGGDELVGWWDDDSCGYDHYWSLRPKIIRVPKYITDEDGDIVLDESATKANSKTKFVRMPNIVEVLKQRHSNNGIGPEKFKRQKGFKELIDIGVAPMCQSYGCGRSFPTVRVVREMGDVQDFCNTRHAKLVIATENQQFFTVYFGNDVEENRRRGVRQKELDEVVL